MLKYNPKLKRYASALRNNSTKREILLWNEVKGRKAKGYKFQRQKPIYNYIVDFFCAELKLVIEIDGALTHNHKIEYAKRRQKYLENLGLHVLRFTEVQVLKDVSSVVQAIWNWIEEYESEKCDDSKFNTPLSHLSLASDGCPPSPTNKGISMLYTPR